MDPFSAREPHYCGVLQQSAWRLKYYEMTATGDSISSVVRAAAQQQVRRSLDDDPGGGVGFAILHHGDEAVWLLCDTWHADILHHTLWRADLSQPDTFAQLDSAGPMACVHELVVVAHERNVYVSHVLDSPAPNHDAYLHDPYRTLEAERTRVLLGFDEAWRAGDVDALMDLMSDNPRYGASLGSGPGEVHQGSAAVREAFEAVISAEAQVPAGPPPFIPPLEGGDIWLDGERALTRWAYASADADGRTALVHGIDLWEFDGQRIKSKDAFRKAWPTSGV